MPRGAKAALLDELRALLRRRRAPPTLSRRASADLTGEPAHVRLARNADLVFVALPRSAARDARARAPLGARDDRRHAEVRAALSARHPHPEPRRVQEYCYYVAGTVGYLLTDLWHEHAPSIGERSYAVLREKCRAFAEALQTVNILKDVATDAEHENSIYIPEELLRAARQQPRDDPRARAARAERARRSATLVQLAWHDLEGARSYLLLIPRRAVSIRLFCVLPLLFAYATLRDLTRTPHALARREVVKISRARGEVAHADRLPRAS